MKQREFNKLLDKITTVNGKGKKRTKRLDGELIGNLTAEEIKAMCHYIVRQRLPVVSFLIPKDELEWLHCMGYLYTFEKAGFTFLGTSEHKVLNTSSK